MLKTLAKFLQADKLFRFDSPKDAYDVKEALTGRYFGSDGLQLTVEFARKKPLTYAHHPHVAANNGRPNFGEYSINI